MKNKIPNYNSTYFILLKLFLIFFSISSNSYCQSIFKITIQDFESKQNIENASVYIQQEQLFLSADKNGYTEFYSAIGEMLEVTSIGYQKTIFKLRKKSDTILLERYMEELEPIILSNNPFVTIKNSNSINFSYQLQVGTHFYTTFIPPCKNFSLKSFSIFQRNFDSEIKFTLAFYEDSSGLPGRRISPFFLSLEAIENKGKIHFKFDQPINTRNSDRLFFEISGLNWPSNFVSTGIKNDIAIQFSFNDKINYTLAYFNNYLNAPYLMDKHVPVPYFGISTLQEVKRKGNPIFEYQGKCLND
ncbi:MAG: hypothetical protein ABIP68_01885 [Ferruginibacter sp.]